MRQRGIVAEAACCTRTFGGFLIRSMRVPIDYTDVSLCIKASWYPVMSIGAWLATNWESLASHREHARCNFIVFIFQCAERARKNFRIDVGHQFSNSHSYEINCTFLGF